MKEIITANTIFNSHSTKLEMNWTAGKNGEDRTVSIPNSDKTKHSLIGYLNLIRPNRIQVIGEHELIFLNNLAQEDSNSFIDKLFSNQPTAVIFCDQQTPSIKFITKAESSDTPLWTSNSNSYEIVSLLQYELIDKLANKITLHGVLMDIFGIGVLITGRSGIGKSELALDLINRGHTLIADDAPEFTRIAPYTLSGSCPETIRNMLEVRGLGLLDIKAMFGDSAVQIKKNLRLIVDMQPSESICFDSENRLEGIRREITFLDVVVPEVKIPVAPGRNLAVITEASVRDHLLRTKGHITADKFKTILHEQIRANEICD